MLAFYSYDLSTLLLLALVSAAAVYDLRHHRIPNVLNLLVLSAGLGMQAYFMGFSGFIAGLQGVAVGLVFFLPFYLLRGFGAGDVKLMAAAGSFLGPLNTALAAGLTLGVGAIIGLSIILYRRGMGTYLQRNWLTAKTLAMTGQFVYQPPAAEEAAAQKFPYAIAIALGTALAMGWMSLLEFNNLGDLFVSL